MVPSIPLPTALSGNNGHMIYVFNRNGVCLLYREWNRPFHTLDDSNQDHKLMFGLLFSLKSLTAKMDPSSVEKGNLGVPRLPGQGCSFHIFRTNTYKLSFMESPYGIKMVLFMSTILTQCTLKEVGVVHIFVQLVIPEVTVTNSFQHLKQHYQIILVTHPKASDLRESLKYIYNLYAEYVVKNPLYTQGTPIKSDLFNTTLDQYVRGLG